MTNSKNQVFEGLKHLAVMRAVERNESKTQDEIDSIALDMLIVLERRMRGLSEQKRKDAT
jgi:hypothetical protein